MQCRRRVVHGPVCCCSPKGPLSFNPKMFNEKELDKELLDDSDCMEKEKESPAISVNSRKGRSDENV